jgi:branched-chain amino acid transport system substrate-binding protein
VVRAAVVSDHEAYGQALADSFSTRFTRLGGSIVGRLDLDQSPDTATFLNRMKADGVQGVYYGGVTTNRGCVIRAQMLDAFGTAVATPFMGGDGIAEDPECLRDAGGDFAGIYATVPVAGAAGLASASEVVDGFRRAFPNRDDFGAYTLVSYDATAVVYAALGRAIQLWGGRLPPRRAITAQLGGLQGVLGVTGTLGFDSNGDPSHRVISIVESPRLDRNGPWTDAGSVDYSATLPY